jgi:hypothetical protein
MNRKVTQIPIAHQNEWTSQRKFEDIIRPWYAPFGWSEKDYGIDGKVEITRPIDDSGGVEPQGQYFLVQLKCLEKASNTTKQISYPVPVTKITQWYRSNLASSGFAFFAGFVSFLGSLLLSAEERRIKRITKLMNELKIKADEIFCNMQSSYSDLFLDLSDEILGKVYKKTNQYVIDLRHQANAIDIPIDSE